MSLDRISAWLLKRRIRGSTAFHNRVLRGRNLKLKSKHSVLFTLNPNEYVDRFVIEHGYYESEVLEAVLDYLPEGGVFWDVGANIGIHAVTAARLMPKARVFCFEPNPLMTERILENAKMNNVDLKILEIVLGNTTEEKSLFLYPGNAGMSSIHNWTGNNNAKTIKVRSRKADDLSPGEVEAPNVVKIDVEGNEYEVLQGMAGILESRQIKAVIFEDSPGDTASKQILMARGFRITQLERKEPTHHNLENFIAVKTL